ncbi:MAG: hypothetical protein JO224_07065 [Pelomonas sp.]|nr:hypothetical protein [Roseateles sp.]
MRIANALSFFRRQPVRVEQDPADMGTAFGMEASLENDAARPPAKAYELESAQAAEGDSPLSWLSRRHN